MSKIAVVYWSGTGNTEAMANAIAERLQEKSCEVEVIEAASFDTSSVDSYEGFAFGCPAMGAEELESDEFEPMFEAVEDNLSDKPTVIFGSYEWNDGEWMEDWQERCKEHGINLAADGLKIYGDPSDDLDKCHKLADKLASKF